MPATPRHITLSPGAENALGLRSRGGVGSAGDRSAAVSRMMERYAEVCRRHLPDLTEAEWNLLRDSLNGLMPEPAASVAWLAMGVRDSITLDHLDLKWDVDAAAFLKLLDALDYAGCCAVLDAVERWWVEQG